jgi:hypothetical protein
VHSSAPQSPGGCLIIRPTVVKAGGRPFFATIPIVISILFALAVRPDASRPDLPAPVDEALWPFPCDTETVMVTQDGFRAFGAQQSGAG